VNNKSCIFGYDDLSIVVVVRYGDIGHEFDNDVLMMTPSWQCFSYDNIDVNDHDGYTDDDTADADDDNKKLLR